MRVLQLRALLWRAFLAVEMRRNAYAGPFHLSMSQPKPVKSDKERSYTDTFSDAFFDADQQHTSTSDGHLARSSPEKSDGTFKVPKLPALYSLERTHIRFRTNKSASHIETSICAALNNFEPIMRFDRSSFKFKCSIETKEYGVVILRVRVYDDHGDIIIELQNRRGKANAFTKIYQRFFTDPHIQSLSNDSQSLADLVTDEDIVDVKMEFDEVIINQDGLKPLHCMVQSEHCDVQREGLSVLRKLSELQENASCMLRSGTFAEVQKFLTCGCIQSRILATQIVANLSKADPSDHRLGVSIQSLIEAYRTPTKDDVNVLELQRQSSNALEFLANSSSAHTIFKLRGEDVLSDELRDVIEQRSRLGQKALSVLYEQ